MSQNVISVPEHIWQNDLRPGYQVHVFVGSMTGRLKPMKSNPNFSELSFEIYDADDPTEMVLSYTTLEAPAEELARWEAAGDTVAIVIAHKGRRMFMVAAYNITRRKWFATDYYPHVADKRPFGEMTIAESHNLTMLSIGLIFTCVGIVFLPIGLYANWLKSQQYRVLNPTNYRGVTAKRIADWITANVDRLHTVSAAGADPSL